MFNSLQCLVVSRKAHIESKNAKDVMLSSIKLNMTCNEGIRLSFLLLVLSLKIITGYSQPAKAISNFKIFDYADGLPDNDVKSFIADEQNGYWFRTLNYVVYFNGHNFITYEKQQGLFRISSDAVESISLYNNHLYVFGSGGVDVINCTTKQSSVLFKDTKGLDIKGGGVTRSGRVVLVSGLGDIYHYKDKILHKIGAVRNSSRYSICETREGDILIHNSYNEIISYDANLRPLKNYRFEMPNIITGGVYAFPSFGTVAILNQVSLLYNHQLRDFQVLSNPPSFKRLFLATDRFFYYVVGFNRVIREDRRTGLVFTLDLGLKNNFHVNAIGIDQKENIVLSTNQGVIVFKEPNAFFKVLPNLDKLSDNPSVVRRALLETEDHKIIQVGYGSIDVYDPQKETNRRISDLDLNGYASVISGQHLWLGTDGKGIMHVDIRTGEHKGSSYMKESGEGNSMHVSALYKFNDSLLLLGLSRPGRTLKTYDIHTDRYADVVISGWPGGKLNYKVTSIIDGGDSTLWLCTHKGLLQINRRFQLMRHIAAPELGTYNVNYLYRDGNNSICWIATDYGLFVYDLIQNKVLRKFTVDNGLPHNRCLSIVPDAFGTVWIPTYNGLIRIHKQSYQIKNYYTQDGLADNEYNYSSYLCASNGDLYFGGLNAYLQVRPFPFETIKNDAGFLSIDYLILTKKEGQSLFFSDLRKKIKLHTSDDRLTVVFSLKDHLHVERANYQYMIEDLYAEWFSLKGQNQINIDYLPPGQYRLRIRSIGYDPKMNAKEIVIPLMVYHYWYESKYFYLLIALLLIGLIFAALNYRYKAQSNLSKVRTSLANDIHDEIGTMLTKAVMKTELLRTKTGNVYPEIAAIEQNLRDAVFSFRNILWSLNTDYRTMDDFVGKINMLLSHSFDQTNFQYLVTNHSSSIYFNKSIGVKRNMLYIFKELAHNALKHSDGNLFEIIIRSAGNKWHFLIVDNGAHSNPDVMETGLGLKSIRDRVRTMKGVVEINKQEIGFYISIII